ncbi:MAG: YbgA family protein [Candidatus Caldatribacteriaceae bacterium]
MKPKVVVSQCLGFDHCRYDGSIIPSRVVEALKEEVVLIPVCPEVSIGLGVPRQPVHIVMTDGEKRLLQQVSNQDLTGKMLTFAENFLRKIDVQGFILKSRSPSCGVKDVKIHAPSGTVLIHGNGLFAERVLNHYSHLAIETEKRLENIAIYEHFLQKIFTLSEFAQVKASGDMGKLVDFHTRYKLLLMAHHQRETQLLGKIVANQGKNDFFSVFKEYEVHLHKVLKKAMNRKLTVNVLYHALGYFKEGLNAREKQLFLHLLEQFRQGTIPLAVLTNLLRSWIERFEEKYLVKQAFFTPYPEKLQPKIEEDVLPAREYWGKEES